MDNETTEKSVFTDTGSTIFVDSNNNTEFLPESQGTPGENNPNPHKKEVKQGNFPQNPPVFPENNEISPVFCENLFNDESKSAFSKDFPDVDVEKLRNKDDFMSFLKILGKNPTLSEIYACFNKITSNAEKSTENRVLQAIANANSSVGSLSGKEIGEEVFFTKEQVLKMSREDIKRNLSKIKSSQAQW